jgi:hypothetical protein
MVPLVTLLPDLAKELCEAVTRKTFCEIKQGLYYRLITHGIRLIVVNRTA